MKNNLKIAAIAVFGLMSLSACSTRLGSEEIEVKKNTLPPFTEVTLKNGLKLVFIKNSELPRVSMTALVKAGAVNDPADQPGLNSFTSSLIDEGTQKNTSTQLAEKLEFLGASLSASPGVDFTTVAAEGLSFTKEELLGYFREVLTQATFPEKEVERIRSQTIAGLKKMSDEPEDYASALWDLTAFGSNAYGLPMSGTLASVAKIKRSDLTAYYQKYFRPNNTILAIAGDFDEKFEAEVKVRFENWTVGENLKQSIAINKLPAKGKIHLASQAGLEQTQIRIGWAPSINRLNPDFLALRVANMILGGSFASRLNQVVRDDKGLTYGIYSYFDVRMFGGAFVIDTFTRNDKVEDTIRATLDTMRKFETEGVSSQELSAAKNVLIGQFPKSLETIDRIAYNMLVLRYYGIPDSYLTEYVPTIKSLSLEQINGAIQKHFKAKVAQVVVYADGAVVKAQLDKIGPVVEAQKIQ